MRQTEKTIGVRNTAAFIKAHPITTKLSRPVIERTAAGGYRRTTPEVIPEQTFRIVPMSGMVWDRSTTTPDEGRVADVTQQLICMPDANVKKFDYFPHDGGFCQVTHVSPTRGYRREARLLWYTSESDLKYED